MTEAEFLHAERVAICTEAGVSLERADEIAREQVEGRQKGLGFEATNYVRNVPVGG